jgi:LuxR family maltose regulon positive regulatory protein
MVNEQIISERFRLGSLLGQGGTGAVYRGTDTQTGLAVAIKVLDPEIVAATPGSIERFAREAEALRALNHPNIVQVLATDSEAGNYYLVMEYVPGGSLRDLFDRDGQLNVAKTLEIALDLADALTRAHRLKIIHRDIKPENILLAEDGTPRLTDFGLARFGDAHVTDGPLLTQEGTIMGTIEYLSPEACNGEQLDARTDIWALGVVLFEMLAGVRPFTGPTIAATLTAILTRPMPDIKVLSPETPDNLKHLIGRMLEKDRENRISSVRQVGAELEAIVHGSATSLRRQPMPSTLLQTKLHIPPPRPNLVQRSRLVDVLNAGTAAKLTLVSAPAGFGKTTLLSTWTQECGMPAAWLSLGAEDNDPVSFMTYVVTALHGIGEDVGQASLAMLNATPPPPLNNMLVVLINELSRLPDDFFLFLDDYHFIDAQEIHTALAYLVDNLPQKMHIVLSSRSDPPLPLSRLRARGQLTELRQADLRFTAGEAATFLNQSMGLSLTEEQVAALEARTEGWIAGLQLAAISLRGKQDISAFVQEFSGSHRFVIDYLADEILAQQPEGLRQFLEQTSILDRFTAPLCDRVTGREDSAAVLQLLEENNLFLFPLDEHRDWYRYHHLFSDFLRSELEEEHESTLHKRATEWFLSEKLYSEAVNHALASGDMEEAEKAILLAAPAVFNQGSLNILMRWLDALPEETVLENSELAIYKGFALFICQSDEEVPPFLKAAEQSLTQESTPATLGRFMSLKAHMALSDGQVDDCISLSREALEHLDEEDLSFRNLTLNVLGQVLEMKGDVASAADVYDQAFKSGWQAGDQIGALVVFTNLIFSLNELGRRQEALDLCNQLASEMDAITVQGFSLSDTVCLAWSLLSLEANELDVAQEQAQRALDILSAVNFAQGVLWGQYILARVHLAKGDFEAMFPITQMGIRLAKQVGRESLHGAWLAALEAQAHLLQGNISKAARWAEAAGYALHETPHFWSEYRYFTFTRLLLAQERLAEAGELLQTKEKAAQQGGRTRKLITIYLLQARTLLAQRNRKEALEHVERALRIAAPENYRRAFLDEGMTIAQLLPQVRAAAPAFVHELMVAFGAVDEAMPEAVALLDPLSERELEVLRLVAKGLSNRQIAETLFVTVGTVKKHLNNIFSKLSVKSRTQAFVRARELGLLK